MGLSGTSETDALVVGVQPLECIGLPSEPHIRKNVDKFGFKLNPDVRFKVDPPINAPENQVKFAEKSEITPVPAEPSGGGENFEEPGKRRERPPRLEPSSDPEVLRAAYEAYKAYQLLRFMVKPATYDVQLAMVDLSTLPVNPRYDQNYIEETLDPLRKLPGLTERELKAINDLPKFFQETEDNLKLAREALAQKQLAQADLEELVESALTDIDELRAYYLKRLVDRGE